MIVLQFSTTKDKFEENSYLNKGKIQISLVKREKLYPILQNRICIVSRGTKGKLSSVENH